MCCSAGKMIFPATDQLQRFVLSLVDEIDLHRRRACS